MTPPASAGRLSVNLVPVNPTHMFAGPALLSHIYPRVRPSFRCRDTWDPLRNFVSGPFAAGVRKCRLVSVPLRPHQTLSRPSVRPCASVATARSASWGGDAVVYRLRSGLPRRCRGPLLCVPRGPGDTDNNEVSGMSSALEKPVKEIQQGAELGSDGARVCEGSLFFLRSFLFLSSFAIGHSVSLRCSA